MSRKKNLARGNLYDEEFPSLSDTNVELDHGASTDSFLYSARLKTVLQPEVPIKKECSTTVNKTPDISSKIRYKKSEADDLHYAKDKGMSYDSHNKTFDGMNSKYSIFHHPFNEGNCSEANADISAAWTIVKKKRANQENNRQSKNEFCTANQPIKEILSDNKSTIRSKNSACYRNNGQNNNELSTKNSLIKESMKRNKDQFKFKNSFNDKHSFSSKSSLIEHNQNNVNQSKSKTDSQSNFYFENHHTKKSVQKVRYQRAFKPDNSDECCRNNECKKNMPMSLQKEASFKQSSMVTRACTNDKLLENQGPSKKYGPKSVPKSTDPGHLKSCHKRSHIVPENKQMSISGDSILSNSQKVSAKPESIRQNESAGVKLDKATKRKRKSRLKRQAGLQRDKVQLISHNVFDKILKLNSEPNVQTQKNVNFNINDASEYPELGSKLDGGKQYFYSEVVHAEKELERKKEEIDMASSPLAKDSSVVTGGAKKKALSDVEEGTSEPEKLALHHNNPITISLLDIITNKTKKKNPDRNSKFLFGVPTFTTKGKRSSLLSGRNQTVNPLDSSKPAVKRGKEREKPKLKKPSHLKKIILLDRMKRKEKIQSYKGELSGKENVDNLNIQSITNFEGETPILTSLAENDQVEGNSNLFKEEISENSAQINLNDESELPFLESSKESLNNNFVFNGNSDHVKESMIAEVDASCVKNCSCDLKNQAFFAKSDVACIENYSCCFKNQKLFAEGDDSINENYLCNSTNHAFLIDSDDLQRQNSSYEPKCLEPSRKDASFLQIEPFNSKNQLDQSNSSFNKTIIDAEPLFGHHGRCFHKVSQSKCLACADNQNLGSDMLPNRNQKNVPRYRKLQSNDIFLYDIRYMFSIHFSPEIIDTEPILSDIRYLFIKESSSSILEGDKVFVNTSSDCKYDENDLFTVTGNNLDLVNHKSSVVISDKNLSATINDKIKIDDEYPSISVVDSLDLECKINTFSCDTNLDTACLSSYENDLVFTKIKENHINICEMKNEIPVLEVSATKSVINKTSDCTENVIPCSPVRKFSEKEIKQASLIVLHSKKFREYCDQFLCKNLDETVTVLLDDLARFQDRMHQKDPVKARMKRRLVYGIREIKRHVKLKKLKCIVIASDIEDSRSEGGLNDNLEELKSLARDFQIPCVFSQTRRQLGKRCRKSAPVSAVGIFNYEGSEENFKKMLMLQRDCKLDYAQAIKSLSSKLSDDQVQLLCQTKEGNPANIFPVNTKLLKEFYPPVKLTDNDASESYEDDIFGGKKRKMCEDENVTIYTILVKYKIINY